MMGADMLIDLRGQMAGHRLLTFALGTAPRQMSYLGYQYTCGFEAIDYRSLKTVPVPVSFARFHSPTQGHNGVRHVIRRAIVRRRLPIRIKGLASVKLRTFDGSLSAGTSPASSLPSGMAHLVESRTR